MYQLDTEKFWIDDEISKRENCFYKDAPQVALGIMGSNELVFQELGVDINPWQVIPVSLRNDLNKRYNDKAEKIIGRRVLKENYLPEDSHFPKCNKIGNIFGGYYDDNGNSIWLGSDIKTPQELEKMLDNANKMDLKDFIFPDNWYSEKKRIYDKYGIKPPRFGGIRGPVTLATSIFGVENLIFLIIDNPELAKYFSDTIAKVVIAMKEIHDEDLGYTKDNAPHGFGFNDDDCAMLNPQMYEFFGYPILKAVFEKFSPDEGDVRHQHSDSAMEHLLPILGRLNLTSVNFGPTVMIDVIRKYNPIAQIQGAIAPFTFMRNNVDDITYEVMRDINYSKQIGTKGVCLSTAGSQNDGSSLESIRLIMSLIQQHGRY